MNREAYVLCNKTVREHPMVLFIVVIVETFVHVQHKSNVLVGLLKRAILRGVNRILHKGRTCRIPRGDGVQCTGLAPFYYGCCRMAGR
jgi:hypothetical protein